MIFPIPPIYGFSFVAIPIWRAEKVQLTNEAGAIGDANETQLVPVDKAEETQWVFKGYQWHPVAMWYPFVNPGWDHWVDNDPDEIRDREIQHEQERSAQKAKAGDPAERFGPAPPR